MHTENRARSASVMMRMIFLHYKGKIRLSKVIIAPLQLHTLSWNLKKLLLIKTL